MELQLCKGENLIKHDDEIRGRPKRTWFEKELPGKVSKAHLNGLELPAKKKVKLTNKKKKKLEVRGEVEEERVYKKTKADRTSKWNGKGEGGKKFAQKILRRKVKARDSFCLCFFKK